MNTGLPLMLIGLVFGGGIGFTLAAANGITLDGHDHSDPNHHGGAHSAAHSVKVDNLPDGMTLDDICTADDPMGAHGHNHSQALILANSESAPSLALDVIKDPAAGWNLHIQTENFAFSPQNASRAHVDGEGHAHVYVNGQKRGRVYGSWVHLDGLPAGEVIVDVTLNSNDHRPLAVGDRMLAARITLQN